MGLGQVFVISPVALDQIRDRIQAQAVDAHVQPVAHHLQYRIHHMRIVEVEVWLMGIKTVPEVLAGDRVPGPVGLFGVEKNDSGAVVLLITVRPHVKIPCLGATLGRTGFLEPWVLVRGVINDQFSDHPQTTVMGLSDKLLGIGHCAVIGMYASIIGNVIAIITPWRGVEWQQPDSIDPKLGDVVEFGDQAGEIADPIVI